MRRPAWAETALVAMGERGLTRAEMAGLVGLSTRTLSDRLAGKVRPLTSEIAAMAAVLDLPPDALVEARPSGWKRRGPDVEMLTGRDRRVYAAAARVPPGPSLRTVGSVQVFVDEVLARPWWRTVCPETSMVTVTGGPGGAGSPAWHESSFEPEGLSHVLHVPVWARRPLTVLHELGHVVVEPILWARPHGPQFARAWVDLVAEVMGVDTARVLAAELRSERIGLAGRAALARDRQRGLMALAGMLGPGLHEREREGAVASPFCAERT